MDWIIDKTAPRTRLLYKSNELFSNSGDALSACKIDTCILQKHIQITGVGWQWYDQAMETAQTAGKDNGYGTSEFYTVVTDATWGAFDLMMRTDVYINYYAAMAEYRLQCEFGGSGSLPTPQFVATENMKIHQRCYSLDYFDEPVGFKKAGTPLSYVA